MGEIKKLKLCDVIESSPKNPYSHMDNEAIVYLKELISLFPKDCEIEFCEDGTLNRECNIYKVMDGSIDFIDDKTLQNADAANLDFRKIINDKPKYLNMFSKFFENCYANM